MHYLIIAVLAFGMSLTGCEGKTGPAGPTGPSGAAGPAGPAGPQGSTGPAGADGAQGLQGEKGDPGPKGEKGDPGPKGDKGEQGEQGNPGQDAQTPEIPDYAQAAVHHVIVFQGDEAKEKARRYNASSDFREGARLRPASVIVDGSLTFSAVAGAQDGSVIPVEFAWEIDDPVLASVEETEAGTAVVTGVRRSESPTKIILKVANRGIKIEMPLSVHNEVKGILLTTEDTFPVKMGTDVMIMATAYDGKRDGTSVGDANAVEGVSFTWTTSNPSVATVDSENSNSTPTIKTKGAGVAKIQAHIGKLSSNEIPVSVFDIEEPQRRLRVVFNTSHEATVTTPDNLETEDAVETVTDADIVINVVLEEYGTNTAGNAAWVNVTSAINVDFDSIDPDVLALDVSDDTDTSTGIASVTIPTATAGTVKTDGRSDVEAIIVISSDPAEDIYVPVSIKGSQ